MGRLVDGVWRASAEQTRIDKAGAFVRGRTKFRDRVADSGESPAAGRYHLWVAHNCPWAHRTLIVRHLLGLEDAIGVSVAHFRRDEDGWWFPDGIDAFQPVDGKLGLHRLYAAADSNYSGSATVPVLWDRERETIVNNESAEIIEMLNADFAPLGSRSRDLAPASLRAEMDEVNDWVHAAINNGVYKCGFARTQEAYESAFLALFEALDRAEERLSTRRYLVGSQLTLADVRLFTTLVRFDAVYFSHFKCNRQRISDYPNLGNYLRDLYQTDGFGKTVDIELYKRGYYGRSPGLNPRGIIPLGPDLDFEAPHDRERLASSTERAD